MSKLLISETPMMMCPSLGAKIGVDEALVLQQIHYLINPDINQNLIDGKHWVYNTYSEWHQRFKGCWSESTIKNIFLKLEKLKLLIVGRFNKTKDDRTKWYTIDYEQLDRLEVGTTDKNCPTPETKIVRSNGQKLSEASDKNCPMYKEQEITYQKNTQKKEIRAREEDVQKVFEHWRETMGHQTAKLDSKRRYVIESAFKIGTEKGGEGYSVQDLCKAITGCSLTPFNTGDNDRGQRYDGLHLILRSAEQIERFMSNADEPPKPFSSSSRDQAAQQAEKERTERLARIQARSKAAKEKRNGIL